MEEPAELTMTEWVRSGNAPNGFMLGDEAEIKAVLEAGGVGRFKKQDLVSDEIHTHTEAGRLLLNYISIGRIVFALPFAMTFPLSVLSLQTSSYPKMMISIVRM